MKISLFGPCWVLQIFVLANIGRVSENLKKKIQSFQRIKGFQRLRGFCSEL